MLLIAIPIGLIVFAIILSARVEFAERVVISILIFAVAVFPRTVMAFGKLDPLHVGIAHSQITLMTYHLAIILALAFYMFRKPGIITIPISFLAFSVTLALFVSTIWGGSPQQWSGVWHFVMALACWPLGLGLSSFVFNCERNQRFLARFIVVVLLGELALSVLQVFGVPLPVELTAGTQNTLVGTDRVIGTLGNAANLSKISFLLMLILLPLAASRSVHTRRTVSVGIVLAILLATLTISRANVLATVIAVGIWLMFSPGRVSLAQRVAILGGASAVVLGTGLATLQRYLSDPEGSIRPLLVEGALEQLQHTFWEGVGVNSYVSVVGEFHATTALGFPVHNSFLLLLTELGPLIATLFLFPIAWLFLRAIFRFFDRPKRDPATITLIASLPGLAAITITGYGILGTFLLPLLMLTLGTMYGLVRQHDRGPQDETLMPTSRAAFPPRLRARYVAQ